jgi:2-phosphosulfolactate phosphatase
VGDVELAYKLREENPGYVLMGERKGKMLPGFDYGNSPADIQAVDFSGKTVIQTTSAGTQGFANARDADELISGSFVNAEAIISYIKNKAPEKVSLVCMGTWAVAPNAEDTLCAEYIAGRLNNQKMDKKEIYRRLKDSKTARIFFDPAVTWAPEADFDLCLNIGLCDFVLKAEAVENDLLALRPV